MKKTCNIFSLLATVVLLLAGCSEENQVFEGTGNRLTSFSVTANGVTYVAAITGDSITLSAPAGADLSGAEARYELCEKASILPDPATIRDWNSQYVFRVKSYSATPREYTYSVVRTDIARTENVQLLTQADVDAFAELGITKIDGNLMIGSDTKPVEDSIVDLQGLASLKEVRYNIIVNRSFAGGTLKGLENIERCGGFHIGTVATQVVFPAVTGLSVDLPRLRSAGDVILNSSSVKSLTLEKLESASSLFLASNSIVALKMPLLKETARGIKLENNSASVNSILSEIAFPQLEKIGEALSMQYFSGLTAVGFPKLNHVGGDVNVGLNSGTLEELSFPELATVGGAVIVERAPGLLKFAMPKVKHLASLIYNKSSYGSYPLEQLAFPSLETIDNEVYVRGVPMEMFSLPKLTGIGSDLTLWDLKAASSIRLPAIRKIGRQLQLYGTGMLETLDISTLDTLATLDLIGCLSLKTVKTPVAIGNLTLNYASAECPTPEFKGLQTVNGTLNFTSDSKTKQYDVKNIKNIGTLKLGGGMKGAVLNLYDVEKIGSFELSSSNLVEIDAPRLSKVENIKFTYISSLASVKMPLLKRVDAFSLSEHNQWSSSSARMTNLDAFSGIASIGSVTISYCNKLVDFSGLSGAIPTLDADKWSVSDCGYNPTYQDMVDGKTAKP